MEVVADRGINPSEGKIRVALLGSFYRGYYLLQELLSGEVSDRVKVVGVATDVPAKSFTSASRRVWQYPHEPFEETMVSDLALQNGIDTYTGRVKTEKFYSIYEQDWQPDLCLMATFGQLIDERIFRFPQLGFYNLHPAIDTRWPSYAGPDPFTEMIAGGERYTAVAMHRVNDRFDDGELVAFSDRVYIPDGVTAVDMHKLTSPVFGKFAGSQILRIIDSMGESGPPQIGQNIIYERVDNLDLRELQKISATIGGEINFAPDYQHPDMVAIRFLLPNAVGQLYRITQEGNPPLDDGIPVLWATISGQPSEQRSKKLHGTAISLNEKEGRVSFVTPDSDPNKIIDPKVGLTVSMATITRDVGIQYEDHTPSHLLRDEGIQEAAHMATLRELRASVIFDEVKMLSQQEASTQG